jgi:predicted metal-dependent hydrolase
LPAAIRDTGVGRPLSGTGYPRTRRVSFRFGEQGAPDKYFVNNDIVFSHFTAGLSAAFPPGEDSFIRAMRRYADQITDPVLKKRVAGFIGQEATHGREHRRVNDKLVELGYPIKWWDSDALARWQMRGEQRLGGRGHLAITAAAEHLTAVLGKRVLSSEELQAIPADPEIRHLLNWHALEELEHKSVAFDVYRAVGGAEWMRIAVMAALITVMLTVTFVALGISVLRDPIARRQPRRLIREMRGLRRSPVLKGLIGDLARYMRPGFHPDDIDTAALLQHWQKELFGPEGVLVDHLK